MGLVLDVIWADVPLTSDGPAVSCSLQKCVSTKIQKCVNKHKNALANTLLCSAHFETCCIMPHTALHGGYEVKYMNDSDFKVMARNPDATLSQKWRWSDCLFC